MGYGACGPIERKEVGQRPIERRGVGLRPIERKGVGLRPTGVQGLSPWMLAPNRSLAIEQTDE